MKGTLTGVSRAGVRLDLDLNALLTDQARESIRAETNGWIKRLRHVRYGASTMRERFTYRGDSLWWFTELYLQKTRHLERAVGVVRALETAVERFDLSGVELRMADSAARQATQAFCASRGLSCVVHDRDRQAGARWRGYLIGAGATLSRLRPHRMGRVHAVEVAAFVHTAFWRASGDQHPSQESYVGAVLDELTRQVGSTSLACVGLGPRRNFRARRWWDPLLGAPIAGPLVTSIEQLAPRAALRGSRVIWRGREALARQIVAPDDVRQAAVIRGCDLWPVLRHELQDAARLQWPWSARAMDEAGAALDRLSPAVVVTYAEAGGWGRALMLEARRRSIPSVGLQHGFIYRDWLNYLHEADEMTPLEADAGFPLPDRTLVFDEYAARQLRDHGRVPAGNLAVTGSTRLDELAARVGALRTDRAKLRTVLGVGPQQQLVVLAAKFSEIADELPALGRAVAGLPSVKLIVKPHPAETSAVYHDLVTADRRISVASATADLGELLAACDLLVTKNSTVALDGLVLGIPALVLGLPSNLSPFVDEGVMIGATRDTIAAALGGVLYDREARDLLVSKAAAFAAHHAMRATGTAAVQAAHEILALRRGTRADHQPAG